MLTLEWESEGLQTVGIVVIICASLKLLHLLGLIDFSEGKVVAPSLCAWSGLVLNWIQMLQKLQRLNAQSKSFRICMFDIDSSLEPKQFVFVYLDSRNWEGRVL